MPVQLVLIRHGESTWNCERRLQGFGDPPLTRKGEEQAHQLAISLKEKRIDILISSDLQRARRTAELIADVKKLNVEIRDEWREHDMGIWTGLTREEIKDKWAEEYQAYRIGSSDVRPGNNGETRAEFRRRIYAAYKKIEEEYSGRVVYIVTHRGAIRVILPSYKPEHASPLNVAESDLLNMQIG